MVAKLENLKKLKSWKVKKISGEIEKIEKYNRKLDGKIKKNCKVEQKIRWRNKNFLRNMVVK